MKNIAYKFLSVLVVVSVLTVYTPGSVFAAAMSNLSDTMSTHKKSFDSTHDINITVPTAMPASGTLTLTFTSFDFSAVIPGDVSSTLGGSVALSGTNNTIITLTYAAGFAAGSTETITISGTNALNPGTAGTYVIDVAGSNGDTGEITVPIVNNNQVNISAKVPQTLNFDVSETLVDFGDLTSANAQYATAGGGSATEPTNAHTITAGTNATGGYTVSVEGDTLTSGGGDTIDRIGDATAVTAGTEQFGLDVDYASGGNAPTVAAPFDDYGMTDASGTPETLATQTGPTDDNIFDVNYVANVSSGTEAGQYSTTFTYTMTANF